MQRNAGWDPKIPLCCYGRSVVWQRIPCWRGSDRQHSLTQGCTAPSTPGTYPGTQSKTLEGRARFTRSLRAGKELRRCVCRADGGGSQPELKPLRAAVCSGSRCSSPARCAKQQESCHTPLRQEGKKSQAMAFGQWGVMPMLRGCLQHSKGPPSSDSSRGLQSQHWHVSSLSLRQNFCSDTTC